MANAGRASGNDRCGRACGPGPSFRQHSAEIGGHKNMVFKPGCGMFVEECYKVAKEFPDVTLDEVIVDTFTMRLVRDPQRFDVVV
jgi:isocitrate/isopropylmalate dehydrogenase